MKLIDEKELYQLKLKEKICIERGITSFIKKQEVKDSLKEYSDISLLKYVDTLVTFYEVPDEISLCINISNCPCHCPGCHSPYLANDIGSALTTEVLDKLIFENRGVTCVCLMGGDSNPTYINLLAYYIKQVYPNLKVAWYSGRDYEISVPLKLPIDIKNFDYLKVGSYKEELGPLTSPTTNQKFYKVNNGPMLHGIFENYTYKFQKEKI